MATLIEMRDLVKVKVKDTSSRFSDGEKEGFVKEAIRQYNRDQPLFRDETVAGDGVTLTFATPTGWIDGFSTLEELEFPTAQEPRVMVDLEDHVQVIQIANVEQIQFKSLTIPSAETARLFYTIPHDEDTPTTIPAHGVDAVVSLGAARLCHAMATFYAETTEATLDLDVVDRQSKADSFRSMADRFKKEYLAIINPKTDDANAPKLVHTEQDIDFSWGLPFITHPRKNR